MSETCIICKDPRRVDIEKILRGSRSDSKVSRQFSFSRTTVARHRSHMPRIADVELPEEDNHTEIGRLRAEAQRILATARDPKVQLAAVQRLESLHGLEMRLHQEAQGSSSLTSDPAFQRLASIIATVLCPDCMARVDAESGHVVLQARVATPTPEGGGVPAGNGEGGPGRIP